MTQTIKQAGGQFFALAFAVVISATLLSPAYT